MSAGALELPVDVIYKSPRVCEILPVRMKQSFVKIPEHMGHLRGIIRRFHLFVLPADLHGHLSLTEKCAQIMIVIRNENRYILLDLPVVFPVPSHTAGAKKSNAFSVKVRKKIEDLHTGGPSVCPEADKINISRIFFKTGIQFFDILGKPGDLPVYDLGDPLGIPGSAHI